MSKRKPTPEVSQVYQALTVPLEALEPNPWNPNRQTDRVFKAEGESILHYGFLDPPTVRPHPDGPDEAGSPRYQIIDGEHRFKALRLLFDSGLPPGAHPSLTALAAARAIPVHVVEMSDAWAKKFTIIANETRGKAENAKLADLLAQLSEELDETALGLGLPYTEEELDDLIGADLDPDGDGDGTTRKEPAANEPWEELVVKVPASALAVLKQARAFVEVDNPLHQDDGVAWGQVFEALAADYLAGEPEKRGDGDWDDDPGDGIPFEHGDGGKQEEGDGDGDDA